VIASLGDGSVAVGYVPSHGRAPAPLVLHPGLLAYRAVEVLVPALEFRITPNPGEQALICHG